MLKRLFNELLGSGAARVGLPAPDEAALAQALDLMRARDYSGAVQLCEGLIARDAAAPRPWELLGAIALERDEKERACECFETALGLARDRLHALCNAAEANRQAGRQARALELSARALAIDPAHGPAMHIQALTLQSCWRMDEALAVCRQLVQHQPDASQAYASYLFLLVLLGEDPLVVRAAHCRWAAVNAEPLRARQTAHVNSPDRLRRLRIGYVSADFREHAISSFIAPILAQHDSGSFEIYCYSSTENVDSITQRLRSHVSCWRDIRWCDDEAAAALVRSDAIDILVDLSGHTSGNRLGVFAHKPAPVQIAYLGYPATTGMSAMDYRITDALVDPPGVSDGYYTETLLRLPRSLWCFQPSAAMPGPAPAPSLREGRITFGSLNSMAKLTPKMIMLWSRLLSSVPDSRLLIAAVPEGEARERITAEFARHDVPVRTLSFHASMELDRFWGLHAEIDIELDAFPYNGGATTCTALWLGVPVVSLAGNLLWSRCGLSLLSCIGLQELVAHSESDYLRIARDLAREPARLAQLRASMRQRMLASPLLDVAGFTRDLEALYRAAWRDWCTRHA
ncbi:MAG: glycosyltransferase [Pseudomonadota bacterium]